MLSLLLTVLLGAAQIRIPGPGGTSAALTAWTTGQTLGSTRNNFTGCVGGMFTVGGSDVTVKSLGRWVVSGNSGTHAVRLFTTAGSQLGSVTVNTSGATAGQYLYGTLSSPVTLSANTDYAIVSDETDTGDSWYDDLPITTTAVAALWESVYASGSCTGSVTITQGTAGNKIWGPLDFKY